MSNATKTPAADRHRGGPGSSHQNAEKPGQPDSHGPTPGSPTSDTRSHVSGGGGERDRHHRHSSAGHAPDRSDRSH
jgi:hypothetical protein